MPLSRYARGVRLNARGQGYAEEIRRVLAVFSAATERQRERGETTRLRRVAVEVVAKKWLMPRLADLKAAHLGIAIEFKKNHRQVDPDRLDFDVWIAFTDRVAETLQVETLFEETLLPVCSPAFLKTRERPPRAGGPARLAAAVRPALDNLLVALVRAPRREGS